MSISTLFDQRTLLGIEGYALAQDKQSYLNELSQGIQKSIIKALNMPYDLDLKEKLTSVGIPFVLADEIVQRKLYERIQSAKSIQQIRDVINNLKKLHAGSLNPIKPTQTRIRRAEQKSINNQIPEPLIAQNLPTKLILEPSQNIQKHFMRFIKQNQNNIDLLQKYAIRNIQEDFLLGLKLENKFKIFSKGFFSTFSPEFTTKFIKKCEQQMIKSQRYINQNLSFVYSYLSLDHINKLAQEAPHLLLQQQFLQSWYNLNYEKKYPFINQKNQQLTFTQKQDKRKMLLKSINQIEKFNKSPGKDSMIKQIELQLLNLDISIQDPSLERFIKYFDALNQNLNVFNPIWRNRMYNTQSSISNQRILNRLPSATLNINSFVQDYIEMLYKKFQSSNYKQLDAKLLEKFNQIWFKKIKAKTILAKGEQFQQKILQETEKAEIRDKKFLKICADNKNFKVQQQVILKVMIKNIPKILVKIYQINLQKHYIQKKSQIENNIDLHFLDPTYQFTYEIQNNNPYKEQIYDMVIKQIKKQRGVYMVDLEGSGISSRAVIRKGAIFCLNRITVAGVQLKFYDEYGKRINDLNIWLRGQSIKVKQSYLIPYGQYQQNLQIIAVLNQYAQLLDIKIPRQEYKLNVTSYYNKQSFIAGGKAKIILNPRLYLDQNSSQIQTPISIKLLKNIRINVDIFDHQNIKSVINFENVNWNYLQDYVIQIPIQTYIKIVSITGTAQINKYNGQKQTLNFSESIHINFDLGTSEIKDYYLRKKQQDYVLSILGMNGEPMPQSRTTVHLKYKWIQKIFSHDLQTDDKGQINLGPLNFVQNIMVEQNGGRSWNIGNFAGTTQMMYKYCFKQGQKIRIPLPSTGYQIQIGNNLNLFSSPDQANYQNLNKLMKINNGILEIPGLSTGRYNLTLLSQNYSCNIVVLKGNQWQNPNQIYNQQKSTVYQFFRSSNNYLSLSQPKIETDDKGNNKIQIKIQKPQGIKLNENIKLHIFASNFIPHNIFNNLIKTIQKNDAKYEKFTMKGNSYLNNKKLSQQAAYVLHRKQQKQFIGNNLQKPHILLKRIKVRDTVQKQQQMKSQVTYSQVKNNNAQNLLDMDLCNFDRNYNNNNNNNNSNYNFNFANSNNIITSHNNFLLHSGLTIDNLKGDKIQFILPNCYSFFTVIVVSNNSQLVRNFNVKKSQFKTKKLSNIGLPKQQNQNKAWSMSRQAYSVFTGQQIKVNRTSKWCAVALSNIIRFAKTLGVYLQDWVQRWSTYSWEMKLQIYNKKACHQLNNYIKHQDESFFKKVVQPFIKNKINKTFVDLCLLEDSACELWVPIQYFDQLNCFQKILLIEYLAKKEKMQICTNLASGMQLKQKVKKSTYSQFKQKFQTMLNIENNIRPPPPNQPNLNLISASLPPPPLAAGGFLFGSPPPPGLPGMAMMSHSLPPPPSMGMPYSSISTFGSTGIYNAPPPPPAAGLFSSFSRSIPQDPFSNFSFDSYTPPYSVTQKQQAMSFGQPQQLLDERNLIGKRKQYIQQFKQVQKTQQFTQVTYDGINSTTQSNANLVNHTKFWSDLAIYFANNKNKSNFTVQNFIAQSIIYLSDKISFTLASAFLPKNLNPDYQISVSDGNLILKANKPFLLFIKQIKLIPYLPKAGMMINHRFVDPLDMYTYQQDGSKIQKQVDQFIIGKQYTLQTLVTNTTANNLQIQLLMDIPQGAIPLYTKQYTSVQSRNISGYYTQSFARKFYFPAQGQYNFYCSNACWGKNVIAKANSIPKLKVLSKKTIKKLQTFLDVIEQGEIQDVVNYLQSKNVFDSQIFRPNQMLWMLKQKLRFQKIIQVLRAKGYINTQIWRFAFLNENLQAIKQYMSLSQQKLPYNEQYESPIKVLEYYPYYSSRAHKYQNSNKIKIRNVQFKETYYKFLFEEIAYYKSSQKVNFKLAAVYYLLLQDRIDQASKIFKTIQQNLAKNYQLQYDYIMCFLDMYQGSPNFTKARKIVQQYNEYPVSSWRSLFSQIKETLKNYDNTVYVEDQQKKVQYKTAVINQGHTLKISIPQGFKVQVLLYSFNLQLLFSQNPFKQMKQCSSIKPAKIIVYQAGQSRQQRLKRSQQFKDIIVQIFESGKNINLRKVQTLMWRNPNLKVKINEKRGSLQVFYLNKPISGSYCKVYSSGSKGIKFYRDGYTDITGTFKYALSQLSQINRFSVLCVSDYGGIVNMMSPPSQTGQFSQI